MLDVSNFKNFSNFIIKLRATSSRNDKIKLIKLCATDFNKKMFVYAYSPDIIFSLGTVTLHIITNSTLNTNKVINGNEIDEYIILSLTNQSEGSSSDYQKGFAEHVACVVKNNLGEDSFHTFINILSKDLRCGIDVKTINKAIPNLIPEFRCQLAKPLERDVVNFFAEPKLDGVRCLSIVTPDSEMMFTRNGSRLTGYADIEKELRLLMKSLESEMNPILEKGFVLDGEIMSKDFDSTMNDLFSKKSSHKVATYTVFDIIPLQDFNNKSCDLKLFERNFMLNCLVRLENNLKFIEVIKSYPFEKSSAVSFAEENKMEFITRGYEGIMIKDMDSLYSFKRDYSWQKVKLTHELDAQITNVIEGTGKYVGMLGAIVIKYTIDGHTFSSEVGSGFTDEQRERYWNNLDELIDSMVEVKYQELTKDYKLRFPVFLRLRNDI